MATVDIPIFRFPVDTRVTLADGQVMHAIDGWPA